MNSLRLPDWDDYFTVTWHRTDRSRLGFTRRPLALPGMTPEKVDSFIKVRRGQDGIDGTADDPQFKSWRSCLLPLGFQPDQFKQLAGLVNLEVQVLRVVSVGKIGRCDARRANRFRKTGAVPQLITWKEL